MGHCCKCDDGGADEERHEGESDAVALLESAFLFRAQGHDASEIHFIHAMDVSAGTTRLDHALGNDFAHVRHGNKVTGIGRWSGRRGGRAGRGLRCGFPQQQVLKQGVR